MQAKPIDTTGFLRVAAVSPKVYLADPRRNAEETLTWVRQLESEGVAIAVFPELGLTGYTVEDAFFAESLTDATIDALAHLVEASRKISTVFWVGAPWVLTSGTRFNAAFLIGHGRVWGAVPKSFLTDTREYYESRWFHSGRGVDRKIQHTKLGEFRLGPQQLFRLGDCAFAAEVCEDLWAPIPPSLAAVAAGAEVIFNLSASNELVGKAERRRVLIEAHAERARCAYVYSSAGPWESAKDTIFGGHCLISEFGERLGETERFQLTGQRCRADLDLHRLRQERRRDSTFVRTSTEEWPTVDIGPVKPLAQIERPYRKLPFVPTHRRPERMREILEIQATALARRLAPFKEPRAVLGLSGGVDSTWAALVAVRAFEKLNLPAKHLLALGLPGPGSSDETQTLARELASALDCSFTTLPIQALVAAELKLLQHPPDQHDVTFENAQARVRMTILFNRANQVGGLVLGTGDLSEIWLGWTTYLGDHAAHYSLNSGIPKTLVRALVETYAAESSNAALARALTRVVELPPSPELLPPGKDGRIAQKTEGQVGPYLLQDFFLYHFLRFGFSAAKLETLARLAFRESDATGPAFSDAEIRKWLRVFFERGVRNQFKRTMFPPGPKVGLVSLSPRADFRFPDEGEADAWFLTE